MKTTQITFRGYFHEAKNKSQVYLHHTAGNDNAQSVFGWWESQGKKIATCVVINSKGEIIQGFGSQYWGYHLGLTNDVFRKNGCTFIPLDKSSIGIEICCWGQLTKKGEKFYNYVGKEVPADEVCTLDKPFKGYKYFHNYTDAQIDAVEALLKHWGQKYGIDLTYHQDIWDVTPRALKNVNGVYTHNSVRYDKIDVYPHPKLVDMLKNLK